MRTMLTSAVVASLIAGTVAVTAAPGQVRPGELTRGEVWIMNRDTEAVPVRVLDLHSETPIRVRVVPAVWEYRTMILKTGAEFAGAEGWETTGLSWPASDGVLVLLKRSR
jgi:hypothetical protein